MTYTQLRLPCIDGTQAHHMEYDIANGPTSHGKCRKCGLERDDQNSVESALMWTDNAEAMIEKRRLAGEPRRMARLAETETPLAG